MDGACVALVAYYQNHTEGGWWWRLPAAPQPTQRHAGGAADEALHDRYDFYGEVGTVPRNASADYGLEWMWLGPVGDYQFPIALNRHAIFGTLVDAGAG